MNGTAVDYERGLEKEFLEWSSWDKEKIVSRLTQACLQAWSRSRNIEVTWRELDLQSRRLESQSLIVWVSSSVDEADFICYHAGRFRRQCPKTVQLVYLNNSCLHRASAMIQTGISVVVHPLEQLPNILQALLPNLRLIPHPVSELLDGIFSQLPWK